MKLKTTAVCLLTLLLSACGGGSSSEEQQKAPNNKPTIAGEFSFELAAGSSLEHALTVSDKDNDTVTVSVINKPDWLSYELSENTLTLSASPTLFDIAEHQIDLSISDGKESNQFNLSIDVHYDAVNFPGEAITLADKELIGTWTTADSSSLFHFSADQTGFAKIESDNFMFNWNNPDDVELHTQEFECIANCMRSKFIPLEILAKKANSILAKKYISETEFTWLTLIKGEKKALSFDTYSDQRQEQTLRLSQLGNEEGFKYTFFANVAIKAEGYTQLAGFHENVILTDGIYQFIEPEEKGNSIFGQDYTKTFQNTDGSYQQISFSVQLKQAELIASLDDFAVFEVTYHFIPQTSQDTANWPELEKELVDRKTYKVFRGVAEAPVPEFSAGDVLFGLSPLYSSVQLADGSSFKIINAPITVDSETSGHYSVKDALTGEESTYDITFSNLGDTLEFTIGIETRNVRYVKLYDNRIATVDDFYSSKKQSSYSYANLAQADTTYNATQEDYMKTFYVNDLNLLNNNKHAVIEPHDNGTAIVYSGGIFGPNGRWQFEEDNSMSFVTPCSQDETISSCIDNSEEVDVINYKLFKKEKAGYWFLRSHSNQDKYSDGKIAQSVTQSIQFLKLCDSVCIYRSN